MSDCGVCIYSDADDSMYPEFFDKRFPVARKPHKCCECGKEIAAGAKYENVSGKWDHEFNNYKTCLICAEIAEAFYCDGRMYGGGLWDNMEYVWQELTTSCFDKLATPEAKAYLRQWWMEQKGIA